ncbi:Vmc-like lipoprotein signal peptide domain-containing protein [Mycolicibacterium cosmeticum]|uniref:Vmc-like lipoprotein signal peptide domain-containing protein n=1 Tax=Mycolicibacterium cosmeticum TaxID=258533 RepID=UPI003204CB11
MTQPPPPPNGSWNPGPGGWPQGYPGGQPGPQWNPQQGWPQTPPPQKRGFAKWIIGGVALVGVIAVTAVVAVSCTKSSGGTDKPTAAPTTSGAPTSDFASANDTGPVSVITEDPSCAPWVPINNTLADVEQKGWSQRDPSLPAAVWGPDLRSQYQEVGQAMRDAADQTEPLAQLTTHRVMRELFQQFIAYARTYADRIPTYAPSDDHLARTASTAATVLTNICNAIAYGSAAARGPLVPLGDHQTPAPTLEAKASPEQLFITTPDPVCADWATAVDKFSSDPAVVAWVNTDSKLSAAQWTPDQKSINQAIIPVMKNSAAEFQSLGERSENQQLRDFAALAGQYRSAFALAIPTFNPSDEYLFDTSRFAAGVVGEACKAAGA